MYQTRTMNPPKKSAGKQIAGKPDLSVSADTAASSARDAEDGAFAPTPQELERLLFAVETSHQINKRFQFFLWAQGVLQSFLAHQTLIVATGNLDAGQFEVDVFSSDSTAEDREPELAKQARDTTHAAVNRWNSGGRSPLVYSADNRIESLDDPMLEAVWEMGLGNTLAHGTKDLRGMNASFFIFGRMPRPPRRRTLEVLDILMPYMHFAAYRYVLHDSTARPPSVDLSMREVQIMRGVRDGKTNMEIGADLNISPLTVKNHVQRILRKLQVSNRAQAVAYCLSSQIFSDEHRYRA